MRAVARRGGALPAPAICESRAFLEAMLHVKGGGSAANAARTAIADERDRLIALVDPAEASGVASSDPAAETALHPGIAAFVIDAALYAETPHETLVRRLARSPFSGMPRADASALGVAAGARGSYVETVKRGAIPMGAIAAASAHAFVAGLAACVQSLRTQGATAAELVSTIAARFALDERGTSARATLAAARAEALAIDAVARAANVSWQPKEFARALRARFGGDARHDAGRESVAARPFPRVEPEPAHDIRRKRGHFSASALGMYASCERRWYYRYVCAAVEDAGSSASFYGTTVHWALEQFHEVVKRADAASPSELEAELDAHLVAAFARFRTVFETPVEYELQMRRARRTGKRYIAWFVARSKIAPFEVVGNEAEAKMQLEGYDFIGYIDRLDRDDRTGAITVVDYKTGSIAKSAREYRRKVEDFQEFQLPFYYWARTAQGERVSRLALVPLKDATLEVQPVELEIVPVATNAGRFDDPRGTIGIDELARARAKMIEHARRLTDEPIEHFPVTRDPDACGYCPYVRACRERPAPLAERFAR